MRCTIPLNLLWPKGDWPAIVPVSINTVQHPLPSLARCLELGRSVGRAVMSYQEDVKVLMVGTGGLSHQLDGKRCRLHQQGFRHAVHGPAQRRSRGC
jgi:protocatechuate 4,5-dioxygenase beta chain